MVKKTEQIVEEQVNRWRLDLHEAKRTRRSRRPLPKAILLSNAYGSNAVPVARRVGEIMGFKVYDREIVDHIATHARIRIEVVETLDERAQSWIDDHITGLFREKSFYQDDYARELTRTIVSLWHHGPCVMVGHGCCHVVPRSHALAVRVVASQDRRALRVQDLEHIATLEQARKRLEHVDAEREAFIRKFFGVHVDAAAAYDMILNTDRFDTQQAAQAIAETFKQRFAEDMQPMIRSGWASDEDMSSVAT